jgi:hypothetical protein
VLALIAACGSSSDHKGAPADRPAVDTRAAAIPVAVLPFEVQPPADKVVSIGRNAHWACVVRASGGVDCWGTMGAGRPEPRPRRIPGVTDATAVNGDATCVLRRTGEVACLAPDRIELVPTGTHTDVVALGTGSGNCVVHRDGGVSCGGERLEGITDAVAVSGESSKCVVRRDGQVVCVGKATEPRPIGALGPVRAFSFGGDTACALLETGALPCFDVKREEGGTWVISSIAGYNAAAFANATAFSLQGESILEDRSLELEAIVGGKVVHWDRNGTRVIPDLTDAVQLAHGCAVRAQGSVVCWGSNAGGVAGQPTTIGRMRRPPKTVVGIANVAAIALGGSDSWASTEDNRVYHWGSHAEPWAIEVPVPKGVGTIRALGASIHGSACVLGDGGAVWCWTPGAPAFARRIDGGVLSIAVVQRVMFALKPDMSIASHELDPPEDLRSTNTVEVLPPAPPDSVALYAAWYQRCVLSKRGEVSCYSEGWGLAPGVTGATDIAPSFTTCALRAGSLTCWRYDYKKPTAVLESAPKATDITAIAQGPNQLCAVRAQGRVTCFVGNRFEPIDVIANGAIDVAVGAIELEDGQLLDKNGGPYACAIMRDRSVTCWGSNVGGALGDGSIRSTAHPLGVQGLD